MKTILFLMLLQAQAFLAFGEDFGEIAYFGSAVNTNPPALSYLVLYNRHYRLEDEDLINFQDLAPDESCQISLHEHPDLQPPGTVLSPFDTLHPDLDICNQEKIAQLKFIYLELGWIPTYHAAFPGKNIAARITSILPKHKKELVGLTGATVGGCIAGANENGILKAGGAAMFTLSLLSLFTSAHQAIVNVRVITDIKYFSESMFVFGGMGGIGSFSFCESRASAN